MADIVIVIVIIQSTRAVREPCTPQFRYQRDQPIKYVTIRNESTWPTNRKPWRTAANAVTSGGWLETSV